MKGQTTRRHPHLHLNERARDFTVIGSPGEISRSQFTQAGKRNSHLARLTRAAVLGLALLVCLSSAVRAADLWDDNDYLISDMADLVVLDENFHFKGSTPVNQRISGATLGYLDWFANGDVILGYSTFDLLDLQALRYNRQGEQIAYVSGGTPFPFGTSDIKISFNDDIIAGGFGAVRRYTWDYSASSFSFPATEAQGISSTFLTGGVAVVPKANGTHELWVAADEDFAGIHIYPMDASGQVRFDQGVVANPNVLSASATMTYDPATRRVLFYNSLFPDTSNISDGKILAMDVETRQVVMTYEIPAAQLPAGGVAFTGITPGPNGTVVAVESYARFVWGLDSPRRVGLSVWDADGSNYRFINLDNLPGYDLFDPFSRTRIPLNILWTGNSPEFHNEAPTLTCPTDAVLACVPPPGSALDVTTTVTDPDASQTLTVSLKEGTTTLAQQTTSTPADNAPVLLNSGVLTPGPHTLTLEVSDGKAVNACTVVATLNTDTTAPVISGVPDAITVPATSTNGAVVTFTSPQANDACDGPVAVSCTPASGSTFPVGTTTVTCSASDHLGYRRTATFAVTVNPLPQISWSGVLQPINADGSSVFKTGRVVPVKFQLTGASAGRTDLIARLSYAKISNNVPGSVNEADAPGNATSGNQFTYDPATGFYVFNWSTKGLTIGTYQLVIDLGDGVTRTVNVGLR